MRDLPPLQWLRSFEAAARHLSFTHAATELSLTQSAVSQQVKALEGYLGHALFIRKARALELTDLGYAYLPDIQSALQQLRQSTQTYFRSDSEHRITVRSNFAFSSVWLVPHLKEFTDLHPDISINLLPSLWESDPHRQTNDVEIRFGSGNWANSISVLKENLECFPVCSPLISENLQKHEHLTQQPLIQMTGMMQDWKEYLSFLGLEYQRLNVKFETASFTIALEMARMDLGIVMAHDLVCGDDLRTGKLVKAWDEAIPMQEKYYLVYDRKDNTEAQNLFCSWLESKFSG